VEHAVVRVLLADGLQGAEWNRVIAADDTDELAGSQQALGLLIDGFVDLLAERVDARECLDE